MHAEAMAALSEVAKHTEGDFDKTAAFLKYALADIDRWIHDLHENAWRQAPADTDHNPERHMFSDASTTGGAYAEVIRDTILQGAAWEWDAPKHIFLLELEAMARGAETLQLSDRSAAQYNVDNATLHYVTKRSLSSSYAANTTLRNTFGCAWPRSKWISTTVMPVDSWSRGKNVPHMPRPIDATFIAALHAAGPDGPGTQRSPKAEPCSVLPTATASATTIVNRPVPS
jgi:hypothetical protein